MQNQFPYYGTESFLDLDKIEDSYIFKKSENDEFESKILKIPVINGECSSHMKYLENIKSRIEEILNLRLLILDEKEKNIDSDNFFSLKMNTEPLENICEMKNNIFYVDPLLLKEISSYETKEDLSFIDKIKEVLYIDESSKVFLAGSVRTFSDDYNELHFSYFLYKQLREKYGFNKFIFCHRGAKEETTTEFTDILDENEKYCVVKKSAENVIKIKGDKESEEIAIIESFGILDKLYFVSDLSFIGGSTTGKREGHSIRESLIAGVPLISGKFMANNGILYDESLNDGTSVSLSESISGLNKEELMILAGKTVDDRMNTKADFSNFNSNLEKKYKLSLYYREEIISKILKLI